MFYLVITNLEVRGNITTRLKQICAYADNIVILGRIKQISIDTSCKLKHVALKKHGLHHNKLGKELVTLQLTHFLLNTFDQNRIQHPISLRWYETDDDNNLHCTLEQVNTCNRNSSRNRKMPVTRSSDFLWLI